MDNLDGGLAEQPRWHGAALVRQGVLAFTGSIGATGRHSHHAVQIMTATTPVLVVDDVGIRYRGNTVIVPADTAHRIETGADWGSVVFLEPESAPGRAAHSRSIDSGWALGPVVGDTRERPLAVVVADLLEQLAPATTTPKAPDRHPAVIATLGLLPDLLADGPVNGTAVAARVGISASRLTHLFTEQVGVPLRRYVLWLRLRTAIAQVQAGDDLTGAAHAAGFADSAHLTRTTREMFGLAPSVLSRNVTWDVEDGD